VSETVRPQRLRRIGTGGAAIAAVMFAAPVQALPARLVYLRDAAPEIAQDMRYATPDNFTGEAVPGYGAAECVLTRETAKALKQVQADLKKSGLSLKVYDCYRPKEAIRAFVDWAARPGERAGLRRYHPRVAREKLFELGYIAAVSGHSRADTVDLTLTRDPAPSAAAFDPGAAYGDCIEPPNVREPDNSVDMGTGFDCFDPKSNTASPEITPQQRRWRQTLLKAMAGRGFHNYDREWWHFTHGRGRGPVYAFSITPRENSPAVK
jgi:D-alanyl-D-alanine dipeptidase